MFEQMSNKNKVSLIIGIVVLTVATLALCAWLLWPRYESIADGLSLEQSADVVKRLEEQNIAYELTDHGQGIQVLEEQLDTALVNLASPDANQQSKGLELYENADYSMTEHIQDVTYKRATQGELQRTLEQFNFVKSARVHITFAKKTLFAKQNQEAKASVFLVMAGAEPVTPRQLAAVQNLVATSVENLVPANVTVLNNQGLVLGSGEQGDMAQQFGEPLDRQIEAKVAKILALYFSPQQYAVTARVETHEEERKEVIQSVLTDAVNGTILKEKREFTQVSEPYKSEQEGGDNKVEIEYAHGKKVEEVLYRPNRVKRISLAVALQADLPEPQVDQLKRLVTAAAGLNLYTGDALSFEVIPPALNAMSVGGTAEQAAVKRNSNLQQAYVSTRESLSAEQGQQLTPQQSESWWAKHELTLSILLVVFALVVAASVQFVRNRRLSQSNRQEVLLEVNKWLSQGQEVK